MENKFIILGILGRCVKLSKEFHGMINKGQDHETK